MKAFFYIFLIIDALAALYLYRLAFVERSNMNQKYRIRFFGMLAVIIAAFVLQNIHFQAACLVAGIPAAMLVLFVLGMLIAALTHKGPWR